MSEIDTLKNNLQKPIVLMGMMGTGKSHIGSTLAKSLGLPFYDSDRVIEEKAGCPVSEIFEIFGEEKFRASEHKTILELLNNAPCIIATGGGAPANPDTLSAIKQQSISVWLNADINSVIARLSGNTTRPLLQGDNPEQTLKDLLQKREPFYAQADIEINSADDSVHKTLAKLIKALSEHVEYVGN